MALNGLAGRWAGEVAAGGEWRTVEVPFPALRPVAQRGGAAAAWTGDDLVEVEIAGARPAGEKLWMQIDNVAFY